MTITETRYALLARLAWELRALRTTSHLLLPSHGEPTLWVTGSAERRDAVVATQYRDRWLLLWRGTELDAGLPAAARSIITAPPVRPTPGHLRDAARVIAAAVTA